MTAKTTLKLLVNGQPAPNEFIPAEDFYKYCSIGDYYEDPDGQWFVVDTKTWSVKGNPPGLINITVSIADFPGKK